MKHEINYAENGTLAFYYGYSFRKDAQTGYYLSTRRIGKARKRLHVYVYETETGTTVKPGWEIHHIDANKDNNDIGNLELLSCEEHHRRHAENLTDERRDQMAKTIVQYAVPAARAWHKTEEGREWHSKHAVDVAANLPMRDYVCSECGKTYQSKNIYAKGSNTFCSNNCKAMHRRKTGVDNVEKTCAVCGKPFFTNKYSPAKYCSEHRRGKH